MLFNCHLILLILPISTCFQSTHIIQRKYSISTLIYKNNEVKQTILQKSFPRPRYLQASSNDYLSQLTSNPNIQHNDHNNDPNTHSETSAEASEIGPASDEQWQLNGPHTSVTRKYRTYLKKLWRETSKDARETLNRRKLVKAISVLDRALGNERVTFQDEEVRVGGGGGKGGIKGTAGRNACGAGAIKGTAEGMLAVRERSKGECLR